MKQVHSLILEAKQSGRKMLTLLIDPDKIKGDAHLEKWIQLIRHSHTDFVFVGGSLLTNNQMDEVVKTLKEHLSVPVVLFPGNWNQISNHADALLFLSLISGRNPDLLIGQHVHAAPILKTTQLEVISTGYMLVDCGRQTTASYMSHTLPIPYNKPDIAAATALAGEYIGMKLIYLDGGSGAEQPISRAMIKKVASTVSLPIIVGGGIRTEEDAAAAYNAGADIVVVGTAVENEPELLFTFNEIKSQSKQ
ncbi:MAG: geranylgeranylglyceryl/heptaprenylglyceryl phosphate synthase [Flavobacteriales bacterium]|jgi:phosphoglycerol geranylgeranyltransferase